MSEQTSDESDLGLLHRIRSQPPGPFRPDFWRSPLRGPWLTSVFGAVLLVGIPIMALTGLLSYMAYNPNLGNNDLTSDSGITGAFFAWPTRPSWLYRLNQGTHVTLGFVLVPIVLAKLWSVMPKLFSWPPVRSASHLIERLSLALLVGGIVFELISGIINVQYWYVVPAGFYTAHLYGAYILTGAFVAHVAVKFPTLRRSLRTRSLRQELRTGVTDTGPEDIDDDTGLVSTDPQPATMSRRGALGLVGAGSGLLFVLIAGQNLGGVLRRVALLAPRGRQNEAGPNGFQVNKPAAERGITEDMTGSSWRLEVAGRDASMMFSREDLLALPQHEAHLAIACVEGWSTGTQTWRGIRLRDLASMVDAPEAGSVFVESLEGSIFGSTTLRSNQIADGDSLLALGVNGVDLSLDHGFPARVIVPANPGVHNTKWVAKLTFEV